MRLTLFSKIYGTSLDACSGDGVTERLVIRLISVIMRNLLLLVWIFTKPPTILNGSGKLLNYLRESIVCSGTMTVHIMILE